MPKTIRAGVIGTGHLGSRHAHIYNEMPGVELAGICDADPERAKALSRELKCPVFSDYKELSKQTDAISLATPTSLHGAIGMEVLKRGVDLLIEKPIATKMAEANALIRQAQKNDCLLQIGHVERFNAAIGEAMSHLKHPRFIEVHRLSPYPFRGTDVSVVLDVMIHDLDLILELVGQPVRQVDAVGVSVLSPSEDIANARVKFASGCIANLTASRISNEPIRRIRVFQEDSYLSIDYQAQSVDLAKKTGSQIQRASLPVNKRPPLQDELAHFIDCVRTRRKPMVTGENGRDALSLALRIERAMRRKAS